MISEFFTTRSLSAFAAVAALAAPLSAAVVPAPVSGDIYLAFRASGGEGGAESYIVKLGQDSLFRNAPAGTSFTVSGLGNTNNSRNIVDDLVVKYGSDWSSRDDLHWGIFGVRSSANSIIYGSRERSVVSAPSVAWPNLDQTARNTTSSSIISVLESIGGYKGRQSTANSPVSTFQPNSAEASSYARQVATPGTNDFGSLSEWSSIEGSFAGGASATALDLYRLAGSGVTRVGHFTISSAGIVQFTAASAAPPVDVDTDGDGFLDSEEVLAGTDPNNASDFFRIESVTKSSTLTGVNFRAIPSRNYQIYYSPDLSAGSWVLIDTVQGPATAGPFQYRDVDEGRLARDKGFYKVAVTQ